MKYDRDGKKDNVEWINFLLWAIEYQNFDDIIWWQWWSYKVIWKQIIHEY